MGIQEPGLGHQFLGLKQVVGIEKLDEFTPCLGQSCISCRTRTFTGSHASANFFRMLCNAMLNELSSGIGAIVRMNGLWLGGSDPRREGVSLGD